MLMTACVHKTSIDMEALKALTRFAFHAFSKDSVHSLISSGYNWPKLASDVRTILITHYASCGCETLVVDGMLDLHLAHLLLLIESASQCPIGRFKFFGAVVEDRMFYGTFNGFG